MIFPFDAAYGQGVLMANYQYADMLKTKRERLKARVIGLIRHDRFLCSRDNQEHADARKALSSNERKLIAVAKLT